MMKIFLVSSLFLVLCIDVAGADDPYAEGEIIFRAVPGAIEVGPDFECTILDQDLAAITTAQGTIRWVLEFASGRGHCFVFRPNLPDASAFLLNQMEALPSIEHAEPNYTLVSDTDPSEPTDFYFQEEFWPYSPFSDNPTGLYWPEQNYPTCEFLGYGSSPYPTQEDHFDLTDQWHLRLTQTNLAWLVEQGSSDVKLAIIDSGVDWQHPDLGANIWQNFGEDADLDSVILYKRVPRDIYSPWGIDLDDVNGFDDDEDGYIDNLIGIRIHHWPDDPTLPAWDPNHGHCVPGVDVYDDGRYGEQNAHGTQMASIFGAVHNDPGFGCVGVCPNLSIIPINAGKSIESSDGYKHAIGVSEMIEALDFAMAMEADIVNISLSYGANQHDESVLLRDKLEDAAEDGIIICCSAGNMNTDEVRWPAAYDCVLTCAVVRYDLEKAHQSSYATYVDFCAPSGEKPVAGESGNPSMSGDEIMAAVKWGYPEPFWPDHVPPHDSEHETGPVHTYKALDGDTSGGAAQLSGAFALLKAHYPGHSRDELIDEMVRGAIDVDPYQTDPQVIGKLGDGLINPYRSLTEWGGPRESPVEEVEWSGQIWVSGDYTITQGKKLRILPGTDVYIANFDNEEAGSDPTKIHILVPEIEALGTEQSPIEFYTFGPSAYGLGHWSLQVQGQDPGDRAQFAYCTFHGLKSLSVTKDSSTPANNTFDHCTFETATELTWQLLNVTDAELSHCTFKERWSAMVAGEISMDWCKFELDPSFEESYPAVWTNGMTSVCQVAISNCIIEGAEVGILVNTTSTDPVEISNVLIAHNEEDPLVIRGDVGIDVQAGTVDAEGLTIGRYAVGAASQGAGKFTAEYSSFTECVQGANCYRGTRPMFLGYYVAPGDTLNKGGYNIFEDNVDWHVRNSQLPAVCARKNWWGSPYGPPPGSVVGNVDVLFHLLAPPDLPPPPDFIVIDGEGQVTATPFSVERNYPNPFNPVTSFRFSVPAGGGPVHIAAYDIRGRLVRTLLDRILPGGDHEVKFNGRDDSGHQLPSGMYLCRFSFKGQEEVVKAMLVK